MSTPQRQFRRASQPGLFRPEQKWGLMVVDANNLLERAIHATSRSGLSADGVNTGGLHAFITSLAGHLRRQRPERLVLCWDGSGGSRYRREVWAGYKASRGVKEGRDDEGSPFAMAKTFCRLAGIPQVEIEEVEADDLIACFVWTRPTGVAILILSGDKDMHQLLGPHVGMVCPGDDELWTAERVERSYGCQPSNLPLVMALTGDSIDGIPGVPGFGTKTAVKILERNDWSLSKALREDPKLGVSFASVVNRNLKLVDLWTRRPDSWTVDVHWPDELRLEREGDELLAFCRHYQLAAIEERLRSGALWEGLPTT